MNWFFIAILGPFFWSISNHIDKFLLNKHLKGIGKGALVLYSTLFGLVVLPVAYYFGENIFEIKISGILTLIFSGFLSSLAIYLYLTALEDDEASIVVPLFQVIPVFGFLLGFLFLGETLTTMQILGSLIIMAGSFVLSLEISELKNISFKKNILLLMFASSFFFAFYETLFKVVAVDDGFWVSSFWQYLGLLIFGLALFVFVPKYRSDFIYLIKQHNWNIFSVNVANELTTIVGNMFYNFALLMAPVALIMSINGYQPIFVFLEGLAFTFLLPHIIKEKTSRRHIFHKALSIFIVFIGTIMIYN